MKEKFLVITLDQGYSVAGAEIVEAESGEDACEMIQPDFVLGEITIAMSKSECKDIKPFIDRMIKEEV